MEVQQQEPFLPCMTADLVRVYDGDKQAEVWDGRGKGKIIIPYTSNCGNRLSSSPLHRGDAVPLLQLNKLPP
jgi:hypothetical protein